MIRITAGTLRGRRFAVPDGIRPTMEMARKAAFDILGARVNGALALDAAAGSGAYGIEALSRGARRVVFVEGHKRVAESLDRSLMSLPDPASWSLVASRIETYLLGRPRERFDLIFHDPPYDDQRAETDLDALLGLLAPGGTLVHERGDESVPAIPALPVDRRRYGRTHLFFYRRDVDPAAPLS